ncbi:MAG: type II toxin-antitoxin system Phd/YefM family antitoxin [Candidatus Omnitrophica bacterium]|nr:type II toxin-antitoxin system Phd/YefM family antitoxin [Candidatus Omnitrophota bacterium]MCA9417985.1 type II toxin-antitoxin system Phd/YefM family antitoxin [Candidatus Omnitrophota bacterium]MCA9441502.1 type II toxin-antitoxin system Phd/YefM family antitoxin [Candidatus Omnitrophota bacterium]
MVDLKDDTQTLTGFKRETSKFVKQMKKSGNPIVLTVKGKPELIVQDARSYQEILDRLDAIEGIKRGIAAMKAGQTRLASEVHAEMRQRYGIPD